MSCTVRKTAPPFKVRGLRTLITPADCSYCPPTAAGSLHGAVFLAGTHRFKVHGLLTLARTRVHTLPDYRRQLSAAFLLSARAQL